VNKLFISLTISVSLLSAISNGRAHAQAPPTAPDKSLIAQGRSRYLAYKCGDCHGANGEGGPDGPDLTTTYMDAGQISRFLDKPSPDAYMKGMPNIPATHPDNQALVAYVVSLKHPADPPKTSSPPVHMLSPVEKAHVLDGEFSIEKNVTRLPDSLKAVFAHLTGETDFKMANPGEKYQETDVVAEPGLPIRRLLFAGTSKEKYFIHYEKGGIAHTYHVAVFAVNPEGKVNFLWGGPGTHAATDLAQLRTMVFAGLFADDRAYAW
jgi:mono/diheme cytochrome c family protein